MKPTKQERKAQYLREWRANKKKLAVANELLNIIEQATAPEDDNPNNPFQKYKIDTEDAKGRDGAGEITSEDGRIPHYHELQRDPSHKVIGHGPASEGPKHEHPLTANGLGPAGETDAQDPEHTHTFRDNEEEESDDDER